MSTVAHARCVPRSHFVNASLSNRSRHLGFPLDLSVVFGLLYQSGFERVRLKICGDPGRLSGRLKKDWAEAVLVARPKLATPISKRVNALRID